MNTLVIDASIAIKWVVEEDGTSEALVLRQKAKLIAPDLLVAECANIFWKKVQRGELLKAEALFAARLLQGAEIELLPTRSLFEAATRMSIRSTVPALISPAAKTGASASRWSKAQGRCLARCLRRQAMNFFSPRAVAARRATMFCCRQPRAPRWISRE